MVCWTGLSFLFAFSAYRWGYAKGRRVGHRFGLADGRLEADSLHRRRAALRAGVTESVLRLRLAEIQARQERARAEAERDELRARGLDPDKDNIFTMFFGRREQGSS